MLVLANPSGSYDPASTGLPSEEDVYFTSRHRTDHPWIAQLGDGPGAGPDISIGGQRLELPLGRATDGECQVRIIDVAAPVTAVACDINSVLIPEGDTDLHLDATAFSSGMWTVEKDYVAPNGPHNWWGVNAGGPTFNGSALFGWADAGPWVRSSWITATLDGTEGGGPAWTPGQKVGFRFRVNWSLDTGGGNIFVEVNGVRVSGPSAGSFDFWNMPEDPLNNRVDLVVYAVADANGEVVVKMGGENYFPSCNCQCAFTDLEVVECDDVVVSVDSERYMTGNLADTAARQRLLGWPYYLKESTDGGVTWTRVLYAGYLKQATMERSLTFLLVGGDAGRGRRVSRAWTDIDPTADFVP